MDDDYSDFPQLTREQAIAIAEDGRWRQIDPLERAWFQMNQRCLCYDFDVFHGDVEKLLGRSVWTHEFVDIKRLRAEVASGVKPSFDDILALIPADKTVAIVAV